MYGTGFVCIILTYAAVLISISVVIFRTVSIWRMPVHLRWELAPVPGEKGKASYGGSYLEEHEWWTKKRKKSIVNELLYMLKEILLLKSVWENNRMLWIFSLPFHWSIYILAGMAFLLFIDAVFPAGLYKPAVILAYAGYAAGIYGSVGLLIKRVADYNLRSYSTFANYFNLIFLTAFYASGIYAMVSVDQVTLRMVDFIKSVMSADWGAAIPTGLSIHIIVVMLFVIYMPFTQMIHFVAKYFTYHSVKWNDAPMNDKMAKAIAALMGQTVSWSARHIKGDSQKNWMDIAQEDIKDEKNDKVK
jgi:nitrate reductase gamma subunit